MYLWACRPVHWCKLQEFLACQTGLQLSIQFVAALARVIIESLLLVQDEKLKHATNTTAYADIGCEASYLASTEFLLVDDLGRLIAEPAGTSCMLAMVASS